MSAGNDTVAAAGHWAPFVEGLRAFVARRVPAQDAEDVTQDVLLRLHQGASGLRDAERAESWVYGIARRAIADFYRGRRPPEERAGGLDAEEVPDARGPARGPAGGPARGSNSAPPGRPLRGFASFPGDHSVHEEVLTWLRPMAEELPSKYRDPLLLADFDGRPQREVAERLGLSLSGAKSRVQRARKLLGEHLRRCCELELDPDGEVIDFRRRQCDC